MCKFRCAALRAKKALVIFRELIPTRTTRVAFWDPPSVSKRYDDMLFRFLVNLALLYYISVATSC